MAPVTTSYSIRYRVAGSKYERHVKVDERGIAQPTDYACELGLTIRVRQIEGGLSKRAVIKPQVPVDITSVSAAVLGVNVLGAQSIFLSGYNSWTDSVERHPLARTRGLHGVPPAVVDRWVLDGSGDYRFVEQSGLPGDQHGIGYGYLRFPDHVLLVGSLDEDSGFTVVRESARDNALKLEKEPPERIIDVDEEFELISFVAIEGQLEDVFPRYAELLGVTPRLCPPLVGFSSWYRHYDQIDQECLATDLNALKDLLNGRELSPAQPIFQIDDGYTTVGDWLTPHQDRFPDGMGALVEKITDAGMVPGLWMAPFVCSVDSDLFRDHQSWLMRDGDGEPIMTGSHWNGAYALDTLNPEVRDYVRRSLSTATREWGFRFLKLDFLYGACMLPHGGLNRAQLMADALELLRSSVPEGTWFDCCGVPVVSAFGRTEYCRIGCDVSLDWDDVPYMRLLHRERVSTKRSLGNTIARAHLDGVVFRNDPDVFFLRDDVKLQEDQRMLLIQADAAYGGMFLTSDCVSEWDEAQRDVFDANLAVFIQRNS